MIIPKKTLVLSLLIIIIGAGFFLGVKNFFLKNELQEDTKKTEESKVSAESPLAVKTATVDRGRLVISLKSPGEAVTEKIIQMKAEVGGKIRSILIDEGQHVKKDELLVEIDDKVYQLELESQEADRLRVLSELLLEKQFAFSNTGGSSQKKEKISAAEEEFRKARQLFQQGMISQDEFEDISRKYELALIEAGQRREEIRAAAKGLTQAEIRVKKAKMDLEKTKIRAPFDGVITDIKVSPGQHVSPGNELFTLVNIEKIMVHVKVLESEVRKIKAGREARVKFSAYPGREFMGIVKAISPLIQPEDKTCKVIVSVSNPREEIKPGMHAEVEIAAEIYDDCLIVPQNAILVRGGRKLVFVVEDGLAKWRYIQTGKENELYAEVLEGVEEGDLVITEGHLTLAHDAPVKIVE